MGTGGLPVHLCRRIRVENGCCGFWKSHKRTAAFSMLLQHASVYLHGYKEQKRGELERVFHFILIA